MGSFRGWLAAAHPFPLTMVLALTALVAAGSSEARPDAGRLTLLLLAMLGSQLAIGWSNDYIDRETDAVNQPSKPLASGLLRANLMPPAIAIALATSAACGVVLGLTALLLLTAGTACGLAYNLWLKDTRLSAVPFVAALAILPPFVWTSLDVYRDEFLWLYALGAPLALAAHLANTLPDLETDARAGRRGITVVLGRHWSLALIGASLLAPLAVFVATLPSVTYETRVSGTQSYLIVWVVMSYLVVCLFAAYRYIAAQDRDDEVWCFRLVALAGVLFASGWLASI
jgi:4-hydroxybenzoate polyprenyltransferase